MSRPDFLTNATAGTIFQQSVTIYSHHFAPLLAVVAIPMVPLNLCNIYLTRQLAIPTDLPSSFELISRSFLLPILAFAISFVGFCLASGAVTIAVGQIYLGRKLDIHSILSLAVSRIDTLVGANLSVLLRVVVGLFLLIIPGVVWGCAYALTVPALILEGRTATPALRRSASLANGRKWTIFGTLAIYVGLSFVLSIPLGWLSYQLFDHNTAVGLTNHQILVSLFSIALGPLQLIAACLLYFDARASTEDFDIDELSRVLPGEPWLEKTPASVSPSQHQSSVLPPDLGEIAPAPQPTVDCGKYGARMSWRSVTYVLGEHAIHFRIVPMAEQDDIVFVPDDETWRRAVPSWAAEHRDNVVAGLQAVTWNRQLQWHQSPDYEVWHTQADETRVADETLEASTGGQILESQGLFHPEQDTEPAEVKEAWLDATRRHVARAGGQIKVEMSRVVPGSVFESLELPNLQRNPRVALELEEAPPAPPPIPFTPSPTAASSESAAASGSAATGSAATGSAAASESAATGSAAASESAATGSAAASESAATKSAAASESAATKSAAATESAATESAATAATPAAEPAAESSAPAEDRREARAGGLKAADLFIMLDSETKALLLEDWRWLVGDNAHVFQVTVFGDIFTVTPDGHIHRLDTGRGVYEEVAKTSAEWKARLRANAAHWLRTRRVHELRERNVLLSKGQVYSWLEAPMQGGQEVVENAYAIDVTTHVRQMADIARRQRG